MARITYLFGAGASRGCLPVVQEFPERLYQQIEFLKSDRLLLDKEPINGFPKITKREAQEVLIKDLSWLHSETSRHASVDTFAKKLFLRNDETNLDRLKLTLSVFLIIEQLRHQADSRYDAFFAAILQKDFTQFPNHINIISWNYDMQFELAYREYTGNSYIENSYLRITTKYLPQFSSTSDSFAIYKLNGSCDLIEGNNRHRHFITNFKGHVDIESLEKVLESLLKGKFQHNRTYPGLSFAWEEEMMEANIISKSMQAISNSEVLVVIGYSFPQFNREIDRKLIGSMTKLQKVYIQAPDAENIAERFEAVQNQTNPLTPVLRKDTGQFLIPNEF